MSKRRQRYFSLASSIFSIILTAALLVTVMYSWYVANDTATIAPVQFSTAADDGYEVVMSRTYRYDEDGNLIESDALKGLLINECIYYEAQIKTSKDGLNNVSVCFTSIEGGDFFLKNSVFEDEHDEDFVPQESDYFKWGSKYFNMCDAYTYEVVNIGTSSTASRTGIEWDDSTIVTDANENIASDYVGEKYITRSNMTSLSARTANQVYPLRYTGWDSSEDKYFQFRIKITFKTSKPIGEDENGDILLGDKISINQLSNRTVRFGTVMISA